MKKLWYWLSYILDYLAAVFIFIGLNKFIWVSEALDFEVVGWGMLMVLILVAISLLVVFAFVFWHANEILCEKLRVNKPNIRNHLQHSVFFYAVLLVLIAFSFDSYDFAINAIIPILVTILAIVLNAVYLYRRKVDKGFWKMFKS